MDPILYFTTSVAVVTLFASTIAILVWMFFRLLKASRRIYRKLRYPDAEPKAAPQAEFKGWHPAHLKRAGQ
jgi:hypothetical protein